MTLKIYKNDLPCSYIAAIMTYTGSNCGTLGPRFDVVMRYGVTEEMQRDQLAEFLNRVTDKNGDGSKRLISSEVEKLLVEDFKDVLTFEDGRYVYTGPKSISRDEAYRRAVEIVEKEGRDASPRRIVRVSPSSVISDKGQEFPIGITRMQIRLDAEKLGADKSEQRRLQQIVVNVVHEFTLLSHMQYRKSRFGVDNANGIMPILFFESEGNFTFRSRRGVKPSDAIKSIFEPREKPLITECACATQIIHYKAALDFLGETEFNRQFANGILIRGITTMEHPLSQKVNQISEDWFTIIKDYERVLSSVLPGDILYISNIKQYKYRHPVGESPGFNVFYLGRDKSGQHKFGGLFTEKRVHSYDEIIELMIQDYNRSPYGVREQQSHIEEPLTVVFPDGSETVVDGACIKMIKRQLLERSRSSCARSIL